MKRSTAHHTALWAAAILSAATPAFADGQNLSLQNLPFQNLTVVELFQSQGCAACLPADANVIALADRPDLLTLSFGVTYWDHLGWRDTFASEQYTNRQWDYARAFRRHVGMSMSEYVLSVRLRHARHALSSTRRSVMTPIIRLRSKATIVSPSDIRYRVVSDP